MLPLVHGDRYACIALRTAGVAGDVPDTVPLGPGVFAARVPPVGLPERWAGWLGSLEAARLREADLYLVATVPTPARGAPDHGASHLSYRVRRYYYGLQIATPGLAVFHARYLAGIVGVDGPDVHATQEYDSVYQTAGTPAAWTVHRAHLESAAAVATGFAALRTFEGRPGYGDFARVKRAVFAFHQMVRSRHLDYRLHQAVRVLEALVAPPAGTKGTGGVFAQRAGCLLGGRQEHRALCRTLYDLRGKVEHLHGPVAAARLLLAAGATDREALLHFTMATHTADAIARAALARLLSRRALWHHFANDGAIAAFWEAPGLAAKWGDPLGPAVERAARSFDRDAADRALRDDDEDARAEAEAALGDASIPTELA